MILLDLANKAISDAISEQLDQPPEYAQINKYNCKLYLRKRDAHKYRRSRVLEFKCSDFDGALFHVWSDHQNTDLVKISLSYGAAAECLKQSGKARLQKIYGSHLVAPEDGYDVTLQYSLNEIASNRGARPPFVCYVSNFLVSYMGFVGWGLFLSPPSLLSSCWPSCFV